MRRQLDHTIQEVWLTIPSKWLLYADSLPPHIHREGAAPAIKSSFPSLGFWASSSHFFQVHYHSTEMFIKVSIE